MLIFLIRLKLNKFTFTGMLIKPKKQIVPD
jgi:hypothetical protein